MAKNWEKGLYFIFFSSFKDETYQVNQAFKMTCAVQSTSHCMTHRLKEQPQQLGATYLTRHLQPYCLPGPLERCFVGCRWCCPGWCHPHSPPPPAVVWSPRIGCQPLTVECGPETFGPPPDGRRRWMWLSRLRQWSRRQCEAVCSMLKKEGE